PFARYWLHNGMLTVGGVKMAKSEGNFITVGKVLAEAPGEVVRLALLGTHYRDPLDWTAERLQQARQSLDRFYRALSALHVPAEAAATPPDAMLAALQDDLNAPLAIAHLHDLAGAIHRSTDDYERGRLNAELVAGGQLMGLLGHDPEEWMRPTFEKRSAE